MTETKLKQNLIATLLASDADLNDTIVYSIVPFTQSQLQSTSTPTDKQLDDCSNWFQLNSTNGQVSLKSQIRQSLLQTWQSTTAYPLYQTHNTIDQSSKHQFNASSCQFVVEARDSLKPLASLLTSSSSSPTANLLQANSQHVARALVTIHITPGITNTFHNARSLQLPDSFMQATTGVSLPSTSSSRLGLSGSESLRRSLINSQHSSGSNSLTSASNNDHSNSYLATNSFNQQDNLDDADDKQFASDKHLTQSNKSRVSGVLASLQHVARSVSIMDSPLSASLLLLALLAVLICVLLVLGVSMAVHLVRQRADSARHLRRHKLALGNRLRSARLAANAAAQFASAAAAAASSGANMSRNKSGGLANETSSSLSASSSSTSSSSSAASSPSTRTSPLVNDKLKTDVNQLLPNDTIKQANNFNIDPRLSSRIQIGNVNQFVQQQHHQPQLPTRKSLLQRSITSINSSNASSSLGASHFGHYSVTKCHSPLSSSTQQQLSARDSVRQSIEDAIKSLVKEDNCDDANKTLPRPDTTARTGTGNKQTSLTESKQNSEGNNSQDHEDALAIGEPNVVAYRKLNRDLDQQTLEAEKSIKEESNFDSNKEEQREDISKQRSQPNEGSLMAILREVDMKRQANNCNTGMQTGAVKWPTSALPRKMKKLTWDDESCNADSISMISSTLNLRDDDDDAGGELDDTLMSKSRFHIYSEAESQFQKQHYLSTTTSANLQIPFAASRSASTCNEESLSLIGTNNCLEYTIVESSQFDANKLRLATTATTKSLQQQQQQPTPNQSCSSQAALVDTIESIEFRQANSDKV